MAGEFQVTGKNAAARFTLKLHRGDGMTLIAMNWKKGKPPPDFVGFAIEYKEPGGDRFFSLNNRLGFRGKDGKVNPDTLSTRLSPIQKFRWVHFPRNAELEGKFTYRVTPVFMDATDTLSYGDAVQKLKAAGFSVFKQSNAPSTPEQKDKVIGTSPPANQTSAITNEITVIVGSGPESKEVPDVAGQTVDQAQQTLTVYGFLKFTQAPVDSTRPLGTVLSTNPATGQSVPLDTIIELRVSRGNQFTMPDLTGQFWTDAEPNLRALGWTGVLTKGADVPNSGQRTNAVVTQSPAAGSGVNFDAPITLAFAP